MMEMVVINHGKVHGKPGQAVTWPLELIRLSGSELIHLYPLIINLNPELKADGESNKVSTYSSDDAPQRPQLVFKNNTESIIYVLPLIEQNIQWLRCVKHDCSHAHSSVGL